MNELPLVSVVFPIYNSAATLVDSLRSVLDQTHKEIEVICVDDGSTDSSAALLQARFDDPRIVLIRQENKGLGGARNTGIAAAKGTWITFVDSDDTIDPDLVHTLLTEALAHRFDIVACRHSVVSGTDTRVREDADPPRPDVPEYIRIMTGGATAQTWGRLYRTSLFIDNDIRFPEHTIHEDIFVTYKLYFFASSVGRIENCLYNWIVREGSLSRTLTTKHIDDIFYSIEDCEGFIKQHKIERCHIYTRAFRYVTGPLYRLQAEGRDDEVRSYLIERISGSDYFSNKAVEHLLSQSRRILNLFFAIPGMDVVVFKPEFRQWFTPPTRWQRAVTRVRSINSLVKNFALGLVPTWARNIKRRMLGQELVG